MIEINLSIKNITLKKEEVVKYESKDRALFIEIKGDNFSGKIKIAGEILDSILDAGSSDDKIIQ